MTTKSQTDNTEPTNQNQYIYPDGTIIDFGNNPNPQKVLDYYKAWKEKSTQPQSTKQESR